MKQSDSSSTHRRREVVSVLILAVVGALGCPQRDQRVTQQDENAAFLDDSEAANTACRPPASASTRAGFIAWARRLSYRHIPDKATLHNFEGPAGGARVEITSPARGRRELAQGCVIGRIISTYRDSAFGFIAGTTYIWADSSSPHSVHLVPDDANSEMIGYNLTPEPMVNDQEPVAAGALPKHVCEQCGRTDWCVYPTDSLRVVEPLPPDITMTSDST